MKNLKHPLLLFTILLSLSSFSPVDKTYDSTIERLPIKFIENAYSTALKKAKAEHKYIFVDAYTSWCGPCKQLKKTTFKDRETADYFNQNFVNLAVDMEKGEGSNLAAKWEVQEYPTLLILDYDGKVLHRSIGYLDAKQLIAFGKKALKKM